MSSRRGFTLLEVMAMLLVLTLGLLSAIALFLYANRVAVKAQAASTAMATAIALAYDGAPFLDADQAPAWTSSGSWPNRTSSGYLNGYYVTRSEHSDSADIVASDAATGTVVLRTVRVDVTVQDPQRGANMATFALRLLQQKGAP
jgi:Tfp pilus assembly protein PilV